jgi:hypothetical protein
MREPTGTNRVFLSFLWPHFKVWDWNWGIVNALKSFETIYWYCCHRHLSVTLHWHRMGLGTLHWLRGVLSTLHWHRVGLSTLHWHRVGDEHSTLPSYEYSTLMPNGHGARYTYITAFTGVCQLRYTDTEWVLARYTDTVYGGWTLHWHRIRNSAHYTDNTLRTIRTTLNKGRLTARTP